jgi:hypothetical protein
VANHSKRPVVPMRAAWITWELKWYGRDSGPQEHRISCGTGSVNGGAMELSYGIMRNSNE